MDAPTRKTSTQTARVTAKVVCTLVDAHREGGVAVVLMVHTYLIVRVGHLEVLGAGTALCDRCNALAVSRCRLAGCRL